MYMMGLDFYIPEINGELWLPPLDKVIEASLLQAAGKLESEEIKFYLTAPWN